MNINEDVVDPCITAGKFYSSVHVNDCTLALENRILHAVGENSSDSEFNFFLVSVMNSDLIACFISVCISEIFGDIHLIVSDIDLSHELHVFSFINIESVDAQIICCYEAVFTVDFFIKHLGISDDV